MSHRYVARCCAISTIVALTACPGAQDTTDAELGQVQQAVAQIAISHITFGTIGLDSNNVATGPNVFPVGVRITNTGDATATNLSAAFAFTTANANIAVDAPSTVNFASLAP